MGKLHELLAVEGALKGRATEMMAEAVTTFTKKAERFMGLERSYDPFSEGDSKERGVEARKALDETVPAKLAWVRGHVVEWLDATLQKESTNCVAKADLEVDGQTIAFGLPATFLLGLEAKLQQVRAYYAAAPTLQPGVDWELDYAAGDNVWKAVHDKTAYRTKKFVGHKVLYEATKEHPAQIEKWTEDRNVGVITERHWSGAIPVAEKARVLGRIDRLIDACKQARQRANEAEVVGGNIAGELFDYIGM